MQADTLILLAMTSEKSLDSQENLDRPKGRSKGGKARAESLSPERRSEIASNAAKARHSDREQIPTAGHYGDIKIGELKLPCAVLPGEIRVISQSGIIEAFGFSVGGTQSRKKASDEHVGFLPIFMVSENLKPFISSDLSTLASFPKRYKDPRGGPVRIGFDVKLLPELCKTWLEAREARVLTKAQQPIAQRAEILLCGLGTIGVVALVDEVTGYQSARAKDALATILEAFIAKELQPWVRTFPDEFYEHLFRLRGLNYLSDSVKRPQYFGYLTNDIIYNRLAPGVLLELKKITPKNESGKSKAKMFQSLTSNTGYPKLREHLGKVIAYMQTSKDYSSFMYKIDRFLPVCGETLPIQFEAEFYEDEGI